MNTTKKRPNWTLCVRLENGTWQKVGAAWNTEKGNVYLRIDEGERVEGPAMLFPYREKPPVASGGAYTRSASKPRPPAKPVSPSSPTEEINFMERKRRERAARQGDATKVPEAPPNDDGDDAPDVPSWLA